MTVYCATTNAGKLREFRMAAPDFDLETVSAPAPEETGDTFEANAIEKAVYYGALLYGSRVRGYLFAEDSGLEVDALGGAPGIYSARFAGPDASDDANNALLLERLQGVENRNARYVCVAALVHDGKLIRTFRGTVEGRITEAREGSGGFGYDPLFYYEPFGCTFGEAKPEDKMRVSHRAKALAAMFTYLRSIAST